MMIVSNSPTIFLSHIKEDQKLASMLSYAIEEEFSGIVRVFSYTADEMNSAGGLFIANIERHVMMAFGSIILASPESINRPWINFELGALWITNVYRRNRAEVEHPLVPVCHSGLSIQQLPPPLNNLNAVGASSPLGLTRMFTAVQRAVGGRGRLRTDFQKLASDIVLYEVATTLSKSFLEAFQTLGGSLPDAIQVLDRARVDEHDEINLNFGLVNHQRIEKVQRLISGSGDQRWRLIIHHGGIGLGPLGAVSGGVVTLILDREFFLAIRDSLRSA
jgi:hypothetical protein